METAPPAPAPEPVVPASHRYDAFVSYAHAADGALAPALRLGLERLTKPWYRRRALNVYLDSAGMQVTPALWGTISEVLAATGHLVVLCSPEAAASEWVDREVRWWLEHRYPDTILLVVTAGTWEWDAVHSRIAAHSSAVPPALFAAFRDEPRYLDLRGARDKTPLDLRDDEFRDGVAQLTAAITGRSKAEITGEDVRQHRRTVRTAWSAAATLAALLVVALVAGFVAKSNGDEAVRQRDVATSRLLAAQSASRQDRDPQLATLLALAATQVSDTEEARAALLRVTERDKRVVGFVGEHVGLVEATAFSPDGLRFATAGPDGPVRLWNTATRTVLADLPAAGASAVAFTPDGATLAVAEAAGVALWDTASKTLRNRIALDVFSLGVSADGARLIGGRSDGGVVVVDLASGAEIARLTGLSKNVTAVALSSDGRLAAAGDFAGTGVVWDVGTSAEITRTDGFAAQTKGRAVFSPDGGHLIMSGNAGGMVMLSVPDRTWTDVPAFRRTVNGLAFVDADTVFSSSIDGQVGLWSVGRPDQWELLVSGPLAATTGSVLAPDGRTVLSGNFDGTAVLWQVDRGWSTTVGTLGSAASTAVDPAGLRIATVDAQGRRVEITPTDGTPPLDVDREVAASAIALDGSRLAVGGIDGAVTVHDAATGAVQQVLKTGSDESVVELAWSADGHHLAAGSFGGAVRVWTMPDGAEYATIPPPAGPADPLGIYTHVAFSPDGRTLAHSSLLGGLRLWDVATRASRAELQGDSSIGTVSLAFSPDGLLAQGGVDSTIVLWDPTRPQEPVTSLRGQESAVTGLSFGPDATLAAGTAGGSGVVVWDVARRAQQAQLLLAGPTNTEPVFLPNSRTLLVADSAGVHRYDVDPGRLRDNLCALVGRDLTPAEWSSYLEGQEQQPLCATA